MVSRMDFVRQPFCALKPLFFEVPNACNESLFIGRQWLFREICEHLSSDLPTNRGVIIVGYPGTGKTTAILQLVEHSCFGRSSDSNYQGKSQTVKKSKISFHYKWMQTPLQLFYGNIKLGSNKTLRKS